METVYGPILLVLTLVVRHVRAPRLTIPRGLRKRLLQTAAQNRLIRRELHVLHDLDHETWRLNGSRTIESETFRILFVRNALGDRTVVIMERFWPDAETQTFVLHFRGRCVPESGKLAQRILVKVRRTLRRLERPSA
jgi:hypothetical protein